MATATPVTPAFHEPALGLDALPGGFDPFRPLTRAERRRQLDAYLGELEERDGPLDFEGQTLPKREARFAALAADPVRRDGDWASLSADDPSHWASSRPEPSSVTRMWPRP